jgi:hypothetical protein
LQVAAEGGGRGGVGRTPSAGQYVYVPTGIKLAEVSTGNSLQKIDFLKNK